MGSVNLSKLKSEIDSRKQQKQNVVLEGKDGTSVITVPKDGFLNRLVNSLEMGVQNDATKFIKIIENQAAIKAGEDVEPISVKQITEERTIKTSKPTRIAENYDDPIREDRYYNDIISKYKNQRHNEDIQIPNQKFPENYDTRYGNKTNINALFEEVSEKLAEQLDDKIIEMFAYERIKKVLYENKDMIKDIVIEIIKELRDKSKK